MTRPLHLAIWPIVHMYRLNTHRLAFRSKDQHDPAIKQVITTRDGLMEKIWKYGGKHEPMRNPEGAGNQLY